MNYHTTLSNKALMKLLGLGDTGIPSCELPPMSTVENVVAITKALNDFGWYD